MFIRGSSSPSERAAQHRLAVSAATSGGAVGQVGSVGISPAAANNTELGGQLGKRKRLDSSKSSLVPSPLQHSTDADEAARAMKFPRPEDFSMSAGAAAAVAGVGVGVGAIPIIPDDQGQGLGLGLGGSNVLGLSGGGAPALIPAPMTVPEFVPTMSSRAANASKQKKAEAAAAAEAQAAAVAASAAAAGTAAADAAPQSAAALAAYNQRAATRSVYDQETTYDQHNRKIYRCRTCSRTFTHPPAFAQHKRSHEREAGGYNASAVVHHQPLPQRTHHQRGGTGTAGHRTASSAGTYAGAAAEWDVAGIADTRVHDDGVREWLVDWTHKYGNK